MHLYFRAGILLPGNIGGYVPGQVTSGDSPRHSSAYAVAALIIDLPINFVQTSFFFWKKNLIL